MLQRPIAYSPIVEYPGSAFSSSIVDPELPILAVRRKSGVLDDLRHVNGFAKKQKKDNQVH